MHTRRFEISCQLAPLEASPVHPCPLLAGIYPDIGETNRHENPDFEWGVCGERYEFVCQRLSYNLLRDKATYIWGLRDWDTQHHPFNDATHVEIRQPANDILEVIMWRKDKGDQDIAIGRQTLSVYEGGFSCEAGRLRIKRSSNLFITGFQNQSLWVNKMFRRSEDGSLVMEREENNLATFLFVPLIDEIHTYWYRWAPLPSARQSTQ